MTSLIPRRQIKLTRPIARKAWLSSVEIWIVTIRQPLIKDYIDLDMPAISRADIREISRLIERVSNLTYEEIIMLPIGEYSAILGTVNLLLGLNHPTEVKDA